jgi:hypothetical protein
LSLKKRSRKSLLLEKRLRKSFLLGKEFVKELVAKENDLLLKKGSLLEKDLDAGNGFGNGLVVGEPFVAGMNWSLRRSRLLMCVMERTKS